jgi:hypothetical protein
VDKMPESPNNSSRALAASSLWLHVGLIGATALAAGLLQWFDGDPRLPWSPLVALFGGVLAAVSWRCDRTINHDDDLHRRTPER